MKRTTISLPAEMHSRLEREARRNGVSASEVVRTALANHLGMDGRKKRLAFAAIGRSGTTQNIAADMEEMMAREWTAERVLGR
jgi:Arc/MetJ-type ribon-helix-helix transcriptional regulator